MRTSAAAFGCMTLAVTLELVRGPYDWSESFAIPFYGLVVGSFMLGLVGAGRAILARELPFRRRALELALSIPPVLLVTAFTLVLLAFIRGHAGD